jgi:hypothetical protein
MDHEKGLFTPHVDRGNDTPILSYNSLGLYL